MPLGYLREIRDRGDGRSCPLSQNCGPGVNTAFPCLSQLQACSLVNLLQRVQMKEGHAHTFNFTPNPLEYRYFPQYVLILRPFHKTFFFFFAPSKIHQYIFKLDSFKTKQCYLGVVDTSVLQGTVLCKTENKAFNEFEPKTLLHNCYDFYRQRFITKSNNWHRVFWVKQLDVFMPRWRAFA